MALVPYDTCMHPFLPNYYSNFERLPDYQSLIALVVNCTMLSPPINGRLDVTSNTTVPGGFSATYFCNVGYNLMGDSTRECQDDGSWSGSAPVCDRELLL